MAFQWGTSPITDVGQAFGVLSPNQSVYSPPVSAAEGPPPVPGRLVKNPDGSSVDPATGVVYVQNPDGSMTATHNPNTANQVAANTNRASGFFNQVPGYDQREAGAYGQEQTLANSLNAMASGSGPTVAGNQLVAGQQQAAQQQLAQAAGSSGNNAALARMAAMGNTAQLQANTNQQMAQLRTQEQTNALNSLRQRHRQYGAAVDQPGMSGQKIGAGNALNGLAATGENNQENLLEKSSADQAQINAGIDEANSKATGAA